MGKCSCCTVATEKQKYSPDYSQKYTKAPSSTSKIESGKHHLYVGAIQNGTETLDVDMEKIDGENLDRFRLNCDPNRETNRKITVKRNGTAIDWTGIWVLTDIDEAEKVYIPTSNVTVLDKGEFITVTTEGGNTVIGSTKNLTNDGGKRIAACILLHIPADGLVIKRTGGGGVDVIYTDFISSFPMATVLSTLPAGGWQNM